MVREATASDDAVLDAIAREGDASADTDYLALVRSQQGRLLVAEHHGRVVGFGGVIDINGLSMLTDLFVGADARGTGIGTRLLNELFDGSTRRMTFSSKHAAALAAYRRVGMEPRWRLLYLSGVARGGGTGMPTGSWQHDRIQLVEQMSAHGAHVSADAVWMSEETGVWIARVQSTKPVKVVSAILAGLSRDTVVKICVPEYSPLAPWALNSGFDEIDCDTFCSTPDVTMPPDLHCLDPGLA